MHAVLVKPGWFELEGKKRERIKVSKEVTVNMVRVNNTAIPLSV